LGLKEEEQRKNQIQGSGLNMGIVNLPAKKFFLFALSLFRK